jgi:hypothetical protein
MTMQLIKKSLLLILITFSVASLPGCWESDVENKAEDVVEKAEEMGEEAMEKTQEMGEEAADEVQDAAEEMGDKVEETTDDMD